MAGIIIPGDRTTKQPVLGYCLNKACREPGQSEFEFITEHDHFACPKCGSTDKSTVGVKVLIHLMLPDRNGPIEGSRGAKYILGCDSRRAYLATFTNLEAATGDPTVANCPGCLAEALRRNQLGPQGEELIVQPQ